MSSGSSVQDQPVSIGAGEGYLGDYYEHLAEEDARAYPQELLAARAETHRRAAAHRLPGIASITISDEADRSVVYIVTDDMPFLVDSVNAELVRQKAPIHLVMHPLFVVTRNRESGELVKVARVPSHLGISSGDTAAMPNLSHLIAQGDNASHMESWIAVEIDRVDDAKRAALIEGIGRVLGDVRAAVEDWPKMRNKALQIAEDLDKVANPAQIAELRQAQELLRWLDDGNFTFLGYREYDLKNESGEDVLEPREDSGLGLLRGGADTPHQIQHLTEAGRKKAREKRALVITKANSRSTVHRSGVPGLHRRQELRRGRQRQRRTPLHRALRHHRLRRLRARHSGGPREGRRRAERRRLPAGFPLRQGPAGHPRNLPPRRAVPDRNPRSGRHRDRHPAAAGTPPHPAVPPAGHLRPLHVRPRLPSARPVHHERAPAHRAGTPRDLRRRVHRLRGADDRIRAGPAVLPDPASEERRRQQRQHATSWRSGWSARPAPGAKASPRSCAPAPTAPVASRTTAPRNSPPYGPRPSRRATASTTRWRMPWRTSPASRSTVPRRAAGEAAKEHPGVHVYLPDGAGATLEEDARVKLYMLEPKSLSQILPYFHNLGLEVLDERPFEIETADHRDFFLYDLGLKYPAGRGPAQDRPAARRLLRRRRVRCGGIGQLRPAGAARGDALAPGRRAARLRQVHAPDGQHQLLRIPRRHPAGQPGCHPRAQCPVRGPLRSLAGRGGRRIRQDEVLAGLDAAIEQVATLDADRVLRTFKNLIQATLRTNYYQNKPHLSFKLNPAAIEGLPFPRPMFEIWVYSPRVEGVHLRFGKVARGGLRWSDRREDFRTEILGLVKAQTVKNAVIVPTGAKGGFFAKQLPDPAADRAAWMAEGVESYKTFIRGLLDVTDNLVTTPEGEQLVPPADVVRHDDDDSYLVVAADKGTASFSDIANGLAAEYGFWLGDAFASGGSVGYDHKAMGITARGAWESVKRHFSELDLDTQSEPFTVVGVGDMSGDVFGNGMLLSKHIRLLAAFDHRHIFLDPTPDEAVSFAERQRLFELPRSSWDDYNKALISEGGGVFARQAKSIPVSAQVRAALGLPDGTTQLSPPELLRAILLAPADLLYNGGIGTYVKASTETNAEVGDKANDAIRVDGRELRVKVVGEGGNLGMTQRGRIEAALQGVILNTDAIDNSAGVDCSDHEVNIKIFVDRMVAAGKLDPAERAEFLASMTDEVGRLVLEDNIDQNILLLNDRMRVSEWSPSYERLMDWLEKSADLKRDLEALPTTETLRERLEQGQGLTSPELSVLAAYAKIELASALRDSDLADDPWFRRDPAGLLPAAAAGPVRRRTGHPPAAPRNHRHGGGQRHDQPGRHHLRVPGHGGDLGHRGRRRQGVRGAARGLRTGHHGRGTQRAAGVLPDRALEHRPPGHPPAPGPGRALAPEPEQRLPADRRDRWRVQAADGSNAGPPAGLPARRRPRPGVRMAGEGARLGTAGGPGPPLGGAVRELRAAGHRQDCPRQPGTRGEHRPRLLHGVQPLPRGFPAGAHHQAAPEGPLAGAGPCGAA